MTTLVVVVTICCLEEQDSNASELAQVFPDDFLSTCILVDLASPPRTQHTGRGAGPVVGEKRAGGFARHLSRRLRTQPRSR
jgi:hypothetical protein